MQKGKVSQTPEAEIERKVKKKLDPIDLPLLTLVLVLLTVGLVMLFSASYATAYYNEVNLNSTALEKQLSNFNILWDHVGGLMKHRLL